MRRLLPLALVVAAGCPRAPAASSPAPTARAAPAPIVVALVIDQMAAWIAAERWPLLPETGGLARLRREGTWIEEARYAHAVTDTAPGHASIFTGVTPRDHGIVGNERFEAGGRVGILRDPKTKLVDTRGVTAETGSSIGALRVPTVADRLRERDDRATIVSLSIKDRGAIFGGGRRPTATLWFDASLDRFVTSTAFASKLPAWAEPHGTPTALRNLREKPWEPLDRAFVQAHAGTPDAQLGEGDWEGLGWTFPHDVAHARKPAAAFRATPYADEAVLALAHAAVRARDPSALMFLAVSLSAHDYINHVFGPDSWESWDELLRIDTALGTFFAALDAAVTADGWSIVLTGDHGSVPIPELSGPGSGRPWCSVPDRFARPCRTSVRIHPDELARTLDESAVAALGPGRWIAGLADPLVFYTDDARALDPERRKRLDAVVIERLTKTPGVEEVRVVRREPALCPPRSDETVAALVCRSVRPDGPGDLYVVTTAGSFFDPRYAVGKGMNHGSPWIFNRSVPIVIRAPGRVDAARRIPGPVAFETATHALAALASVPRAESCCGEHLVR